VHSRHWLIGERELKGAADLQDKQDKLTATTAKNRKNELRGPKGFGASIYLLSEAIGPLFEVATLTGFEADCSQSGAPERTKCCKIPWGAFSLIPFTSGFLHE